MQHDPQQKGRDTMRRRSQATTGDSEQTTTAEGAKVESAEESKGAKVESSSGTTEDRSSVTTREEAAKRLEALVFGNRLERVIEHVFAIDLWKEFDELEAKLAVGNVAGAEYGKIAEALDSSETNARMAHRVFVAGALARDNFEREATIILAGMRDAASRSLQNEKAGGERSKAITDADVTARMASMFPDEWLRLEERRAKAQRTSEHLDHLAKLWKGRPSSLQAILTTMRR